MKVKELASRLAEMDPEADVTVHSCIGCHGYEDTYQISGTDFFDASENYPAEAFIEFDKGCMCQRGTGIKRLSKGPNDLNQRTLGVEDALKVLEENISRHSDILARLGNGKDYVEHLEVERHKNQKVALENVYKTLRKKIT